MYGLYCRKVCPDMIRKVGYYWYTIFVNYVTHYSKRQLDKLINKNIKKNSHKYPLDVDLGQLEVLKTLKNIKSENEGCAIKCTAACENHAGKLRMPF